MDIKEVVSKRDASGRLVESLIAEALIIEENTRQSLTLPTASNKERFLALVATEQGGVNLVKGKFSESNGHQVGRTWNLAELGTLESLGNEGVNVVIGKEYYWRFRNAAEKKAFCGKMNTYFRNIRKVDVPKRLGWSDPIWSGIWEQGPGGKRPNPIQTPKQQMGQQVDTRVISSNHDLSRPSFEGNRRPSRGPNSPVSPAMSSPELGSFPEIGQKQRYKPQTRLSKQASQSSLRQQIHQQTYGQAPPQPSRSGGKPATPYPVSPLVDTFGEQQKSPVIDSGRRSHDSSSRSSLRDQAQNRYRMAKASSDSLPRQAAQPSPVKQAQYQHQQYQPTTQQQPQQQQQYNTSTAPLNTNSPSRNQRSSQSGPDGTRVSREYNRQSTGANPVTVAAATASGASAVAAASIAPADQRPRSPTRDSIPSRPQSQSSSRTKYHQKQQSDSSDASFMSAQDDTIVHETAGRHVRDGSMHQNISLGSPPVPPQPNQLEAPFVRQANETRNSHHTLDSIDAVAEAPTSHRQSQDLTFSPSSAQPKKIHRLSPVKIGDFRSPRRSKQFTATHTRNTSNTSISSIRSQQGDDDQFQNLNNVLLQLQFTGEDSFETLEKKINWRIAQTNDAQVSKVVSLDDELDDLDKLLEDSIGMCKSLSDTFATVAVNLATIGPQIASIENKSEGSQVLDMNKRVLVSEIERLLNSIRLPKSVTSILMRTKFGLDELPMVEANLAELYKAFEVLNSSSTSMSIAREQSDLISSTSESFNLEFAAFFKGQLRRIFDSSTGLDRVDADILRELYPYSALVLFSKDTSQSAYKKLLMAYENLARSHIDESLPPFTITWKRKLESAVGKDSKFSFKTQGKTNPHEEASSSTTLKRGMSVKVGSHSVGLKSDPNKYQHKALPSKGINHSQLATINSSFDELVNTWSEQIAAQQQVLVKLFHLSSSSSRNYGAYIHTCPLRVRKEAALQFGGPPKPQEADSSLTISRNLQKLMGKIFNAVDEQIRQVADLVTSTSTLQAVYLIGFLEQKQDALSTSDQEYAKQLWLRLREMLLPQWRKFIEKQSRYILDTHINMSKRVGIIPVAEAFVTFVKSVEASMKSLGGEVPKTRKEVNESHEQIFRAITQVFSRSGRPLVGTGATATHLSNSMASEDKEALNYHVTMIENFYVIIHGLMKDDENPPVVETILTEARTLYRKELESYIADIEQRPLGRILEFLPRSNGQTPKFKSSTFKKVVANYDTKELRKNADVLRKRVQKHFGDEIADNVLVGKVWSAISAGFESKFTKIIDLAKQHELEGVVPITRQEVREIMQSFA